MWMVMSVCKVYFVHILTCIASLVNLACSTDFSFLCEVSWGIFSVVAGAGTWLSSILAWFAPWLFVDAGSVVSSSPGVSRIVSVKLWRCAMVICPNLLMFEIGQHFSWEHFRCGNEFNIMQVFLNFYTFRILLYIRKSILN